MICISDQSLSKIDIIVAFLFCPKLVQDDLLLLSDCLQADPSTLRGWKNSEGQRA